MKKMLDKIDQYKRHICSTVIRMNQSVNPLHEIALNKNVLTTDEYFDTLINSERNGNPKEPGWENRVKQLESMKTNNKLLKEIVIEEKEPSIITDIQNKEVANIPKKYLVLQCQVGYKTILNGIKRQYLTLSVNYNQKWLGFQM